MLTNEDKNLNIDKRHNILVIPFYEREENNFNDWPERNYGEVDGKKIRTISY